LLLIGAAAATAGLVLGGRRTKRTRYRPDPWHSPEWVVAVAGLCVAALVSVAGHVDHTALSPTTTPLVSPTLPLLATVGVLLGLLPAWAAPVQSLRRRHVAPAGATT
jgi:energy-coupling factor transport system permease protein